MIRAVIHVILLTTLVMPVGILLADDVADDQKQTEALEREVEKLKTAHAVWEHNDREYRRTQEQGDASEAETREYAIFVVMLKRQVLEAAEAVRRQGGDVGDYGINEQELKGQAESESDDAHVGDSPLERLKQGETVEQVNRDMSEADPTAAYDAELEEKLAEIDGILLKEQQAIKGTAGGDPSNSNWTGDDGADNNGKFAEASGDAGGGNSEGQPTDSEGGGSAGTGMASANATGEGTSEQYEPGAGPGVSKGEDLPEFVSKDIPDGSDDDVVLKQLREAAEAETDPALKEELWNEYKRYKNAKH